MRTCKTVYVQGSELSEDCRENRRLQSKLIVNFLHFGQIVCLLVLFPGDPLGV